MHPSPIFDEWQPTLENGVVQLRPACADDVELIFAACQDPESARYTTMPSPYTHDDAVAFVEDYAPAHWRERRGVCWVMTAAGSDDFRGSVDMRVMPGDHEQADIGFNCAPWARGHGLTTAAVRLACRWGFAVLGLRRIVWQAYVGNDASRRVAEKSGFVYEGLQRQALVHRGERLDCWTAGLLPSDLAEQ